MLQHKKIIELLYASLAELKNNDLPAILGWLESILLCLEREKEFFYFLEKREDFYPKLLAPSLCAVNKIVSYHGQYTAVGIDGSQIYPDRHYTINCFLINIGMIVLEYKNKNPLVIRKNEPFLYTNWDTFGDQIRTAEIVDTERFLLELKSGLDIIEYNQNITKIPHLVFIDGPLIFWQLFNKPQEIQEHFFKQYQSILKKYQEKKIPVVGYISNPKSKELMHIIKKYISYKKIKTPELIDISQLIDSNFLSLFLEAGQYSVFFKIADYITSCYMATKKEYVRLEFPSWILENEEQKQFVLSAVFHQIQNGFGYPTVLSLAHELAVIKEADRQFFIKSLHKILEKEGMRQNYTEKNMKKVL